MLINVLTIYYELLSCMQNFHLQEYHNNSAAHHAIHDTANELFNSDRQHHTDLNKKADDVNLEHKPTKFIYFGDTNNKESDEPFNNNIFEMAIRNNKCKKENFAQTKNKYFNTMFNNKSEAITLGITNFNEFYGSSRNSEMASMPKYPLDIGERYNYGEKDNLVKALNNPINTMLKDHCNAGCYREITFQNKSDLCVKLTVDNIICNKIQENEHPEHDRSTINKLDEKIRALNKQNRKDIVDKRKNSDIDEQNFIKDKLHYNVQKRIKIKVKHELKSRRQPIAHNHGLKNITVEYQYMISINNANRLLNSDELSLYKPKSNVAHKTDKETKMPNTNIINKLLVHTSNNNNIIQKNTIKNKN